MKKEKIILAIMDGVGYSEKKVGNAVKLANPKFLKRAMKRYSCQFLDASEKEVGLPQGQFGNSEVGHQNIGAGRVVYQELMTINNAIKNGAFFENSMLLNLFKQAKVKRKAIHLIGVISNGCVHGSIEHIFAILQMANQLKFKKLFIHAIADGRDTLPDVSNKFLIDLIDKTKEYNVGQVVSLSGRYYAMDRDCNFDRTKLAYETIVLGKGDKSSNLVKTLNKKLKSGETDEFLVPFSAEDYYGFKKGDFCLFTNFRADRARQLCSAIADEKFDKFQTREVYSTMTMTNYGKHFDCLGIENLFKTKELKNNLTEWLSKKGKRILKIAETTKYAHVTYFFNGLREKEYENEQRVLFDSDNIATFDLKPQMQAEKIANCCVKAIEDGKYDLIVLNFANGDMVGHTGNLSATVEAIKKVDECLKKIFKNKKDFTLIVTADHGNAEMMIDENDRKITSHTLNKVPFILCDKSLKLKSGNYALCDIAPTILDLLNIEKPKEMTGQSMLLSKKP